MNFQRIEPVARFRDYVIAKSLKSGGMIRLSYCIIVEKLKVIL